MSIATSAFHPPTRYYYQQNTMKESLPSTLKNNNKSMSIHNLLESSTSNNTSHYTPPSSAFISRPKIHNYTTTMEDQYKISPIRQQRSNHPFKDMTPRRAFHRVIPNHEPYPKQYTNMKKKPRIRRNNALQVYISYMTYTDITRKKKKAEQQQLRSPHHYSPIPTNNTKLIVEKPLTAFLYRSPPTLQK